MIRFRVWTHNLNFGDLNTPSKTRCTVPTSLQNTTVPHRVPKGIMSQVVRERAARLFDSLDDLPNTPPRLPGPVPRKKKRSRECGNSASRTGTSSITKRRRKGTGATSKSRKDTSLVSKESPNSAASGEDVSHPKMPKRRSKRLQLSKKDATRSVLHAALSELSPSLVFTTSESNH